MPDRPPIPCAYPGCAEFTLSGCYCTAHAPRVQTDRNRLYDAKRKQTPELALAAKVRSSARWGRVRAMLRRRWPVCCDPFRRGCTAPTAQISHIKSIGTHPELAFHESNLAPSCSRCEALVSAIERRGEDPSHLFDRWDERYPVASVNANKSAPSATQPIC